LTRISRDWCAILEFRFHEFVAHDGANGLAEKITVTLENCRLEALKFCAARKMRGRPGHAEACVARPAAGRPRMSRAWPQGGPAAKVRWVKELYV